MKIMEPSNMSTSDKPNIDRMKNIFQSSGTLAILIILFSGSMMSLKAQTYPVPGFTLPNGEIIYITYDVDVNANIPNTACQIVSQGTVSGSNFPSVLTDDPAYAGSNNPTITPILQPAFITLCPGDTIVSATEGTCSKSMSFVSQAIGCPGVTLSYCYDGNTS
jgi:hypothetical protein